MITITVTKISVDELKFIKFSDKDLYAHNPEAKKQTRRKLEAAAMVGNIEKAPIDITIVDKYDEHYQVEVIVQATTLNHVLVKNNITIPLRVISDVN